VDCQQTRVRFGHHGTVIRQKWARLLCACLTLPGAAVTAIAADDGDKPHYRFYGFVQMDAIYDFNRVDPDWNDMLRPSKIPVNCPGDPGCGEDGETVFSVRQTRAGVDVAVPTGLGELQAKLEFELVGVGNDAGKTTPRLRHAWGQIGAFGAGQTWSTFMDPDVFPNTIEYWGPPGMIFFRNMQARWQPIRGDGNTLSIALESPTGAIDSGKVSSVDPGLNIRERTPYPDLSANWRMDRDWGHAQIAGILRTVGYETTTTANNKPSGEETGAGINLSGSLKVGARDKLMAQLAYGEAIASYFNDGGIDLAPTASLNATTLPILGWLLFYDHYWNDRWSTSLGWSQADQDNSSGQNGDAFAKSQYGVINLLYYPTNNIMVGGELQYAERELNDGRSGDDTRVQVSFKFSF